MLVFYSIFYAILFKFISNFLPETEYFGNTKDLEKTIIKNLLPIITIIFLIIIYSFKNVYLFIVLLIIYSIIINIFIQNNLFHPDLFIEDVHPYIKKSFFMIFSFNFALFFIMYKDNQYLLLLLLSLYLLILKILPMYGILEKDDFYNVIYPFFYIILFYICLFFLEKIKDIRQLHIFQI